MENTILVLSIGITIFMGFLAYKIREIGGGSGNSNEKMLFEYIEALRKEIRESNNENRRDSQERLDKLDDRLAKGLKFSSESLQKQFSQSSELIQEVTKKLTMLDETNKQVLGFSEQMQSLENILKNPKQRGILGEYFLESLLGQVLAPDQYKMQYKFKNDVIVDAAIFFRDKIIPIDAKFSLEKYNRIMEENDGDKRDKLEKEFRADIKNRID